MNWLDILIIIVAALGFTKGMFDGFVKQIISLLALVLAIFFSGDFAELIRHVVVNMSFIYESVPHYIINVFCYILAFIILLAIFIILGKILHKVIKATPLSLLNKIVGGVVGICIALVTISLCFNLLLAADKNAKVIKKQAKTESAFYYGIEGIAPNICPSVRKFFERL